jgi:DNA repair exonuclease SbcCD ATPase subunit
MNKVYLIFPLIGILIFGGFYVSFTKTYDAKLAAIKAKVEEEKKAKAKQQEIDRNNAIKSAIEAQARRKLEREAKEKVEEDKKTARQAAEDLRQHNYDERNKFRDQVGRLKKDLEEIKATFAKIAEEKKRYADEDVFLKTYVTKAEANVKYYYDLLEKIAAAEKAAADAAAAAAAAAKKG